MNGVVPQEFSELELGGLPIVVTDATDDDAGGGIVNPPPNFIVQHEGGGELGVTPVKAVEHAPESGGDDSAESDQQGYEFLEEDVS
jgi:hypothetical protein